MKLLRRILVSGGLCAGLVPAHGADIIACVVADNVQGNPTYYGMATTATQLRCEIANKDFFPTLKQLYQQGWRLIDVVGGDHALSMGQRGPSPLYLLERNNVPAAGKGGAKKNGAAAPAGAGKKNGSAAAPPADNKKK